MEWFGDSLESKIGRMPIPKEEVDVGARTKLDRTYGMSRTSRQGTGKASASRYRCIWTRLFQRTSTVVRFKGV